MILELKNLCKTYIDSEEQQTVQALINVNLSVKIGEFFSILGPSGCGKTTLLRIIAGLEQHTSGEVFINGEQFTEPWSHVGFVFEEYALFPWRTVSENIEFGLEMKSLPRQDRRQRALEYIHNFGMDGFADKYPTELSGGMKQRVAIARTLINNPDIILMDEPFGSLDSQTRNTMQEFLLSIWQNSNKTILFVTPTRAQRLAPGRERRDAVQQVALSAGRQPAGNRCVHVPLAHRVPPRAERTRGWMRS